jgi:hypothetical protein
MAGIPPTRDAREPQPLNRRRALRVLGALAAAAAGAAAVGAFRPEQASAYVQTEPSTQFTGPIEATGSNAVSPDGATVIGTNTSGVGSSGGGVGVYGVNNTGSGTGVWGTGYWGVYGSGTSGGGVWGYSNSSIGVRGTSLSDSHGAVEGNNYSAGTGVQGTSAGAIGVWGVTSSSGQGLANPAVAGSNDGGGAGLVGFTTGPSSIGLAGATDSGIGAYGSSQSGIGLFGYSNTGFAINGNSPGGGYAAYFNGPVFVTGSFTAMGAKSAAVKTKGGLSRVYSLECPESWFEDFGSSQLTVGQATVSLEPGFAGIVHTDTYHVFLTAYGDSQGLYVSERHSSGFTVREQQGGKSNTAFDYRVVAKRADIAGARLEHIDQPQPIDGPQEPVLDHAPKPPSIQTPDPKQGPSH